VSGSKTLVDKYRAGRYLGVSAATVQTWAWRGLLPSVKVRRRRLYRLADLDDWVRRQNPATTARDG
jgi:excisionase family DNA binding protein